MKALLSITLALAVLCLGGCGDPPSPSEEPLPQKGQNKPEQNKKEKDEKSPRNSTEKETSPPCPQCKKAELHLIILTVDEGRGPENRYQWECSRCSYQSKLGKTPQEVR